MSDKDDKHDKAFSNKAYCTISLSGDLMLGRSFDAKIQKRLAAGMSPEKISKAIWSSEFLDLVQGSEWIGNLETSITNYSEKWPDKIFNFKMSPFTAAILLPKSLVAVNLANNHILDYQEHGLKETIVTLDKLGIGHAGAGMNKLEAQMPYIWNNEDGITFGLMGAGDHPDDFAAGGTWPGINYIDIDDEKNIASFLRNIKVTSKSVDILIVYLHVGSNWQTRVDDKVQNLAHLMIDNGAKIVAITSPHHLQPVETYKNGVIFYSLGDQIDDYAIDPDFRNDLTMLAQVRVSVNKKILTSGVEIEEIRVFPMKIDNMSVKLLRKQEDKTEYDLVINMLS